MQGRLGRPGKGFSIQNSFRYGRRGEVNKVARGKPTVNIEFVQFLVALCVSGSWTCRLQESVRNFESMFRSQKLINAANMGHIHALQQALRKQSELGESLTQVRRPATAVLARNLFIEFWFVPPRWTS